MKNKIFYLTVLWPGTLTAILAAVSIFGLSYYAGYIEGMGFDYLLFPLDGWDNAIVWAYFACREYTAHVLMDVNIHTFFITAFIFAYLLLLLFLKRKDISAYLRSWLLSKKEQILPFIGWSLKPIVQELIRVLQWSNYFMLILSGTLYIYLILMTIPDNGINYGKLIGIEHSERLLKTKENLCKGSDKPWNKCITVSTSHLKGENLSDKIEVRLIVKSETMLGIFTKDGPVTMSMPEYIYYKSIKNECFDNGCKDKATGDGNSLPSEVTFTDGENPISSKQNGTDL